MNDFLPRSCHVMAKPSGSICNLDCTYCFYLEKEHLYPDRKLNWKMEQSTVEAFIQQQIDAQHGTEVVIAWQGGEPTLLGLDFFETAMQFVDKHAKGKTVSHTMQTNGILLDNAWCLFFKKHDFLIGISIDGPEEMHDKYRLTRSGKPTHAKVIQAILLLQEHQVDFNTLTVVSDFNVKSPLKLYHYLKSIGSNNIQFIPLVERISNQADENGLYLISPQSNLASTVTPWSVKPQEFGQFLAEIFTEWVKHDIGTVYIQTFEQAFAAWAKMPAIICVFAPRCGSNFALEANGDLYACDHYVYPEYKLGNIHETSIKAMNESSSNLVFGKSKSASLTKKCQQCEFKFACHGGCPKHRFTINENGEPGHNYLCGAYEMFFRSSNKNLKLMSTLWERGHSPMLIKEILK